MPRTDRVFRGLFNGLALLGVLAVLSGHYSPIAALMNLARILAALASLILPLLLLRRDAHEASIYLLAFGFLLLAVILISLEQQGYVLANWNWMTDDLLQAATLPHVIVMHLMVARRFQLSEADRLHAERELRLQQGQQREQSQFLSLLAHEIRNPLAIVDGAAQLLDLSGQADPRQIQQIRAGTGRIADLLKNCLSIERIGDAGWQLELASTDIRDITRAACAGHPSPRHTIHCRLEALPERFDCDGALIRILLDNLLDNAIKYSPKGGSIEVHGWLEAETVVLEVADQGVGIAPEQVEQVFRRFYRTRQVADVPGAGLGLSMVRRIAELHDGRITCTATPGQGTRMTLRLPIR
jgi:signal transduction histidine kinase